jgi:hypothetical protein
MANTEGLAKQLRALAQRGIEPARHGLMREIKRRIPRRLIAHRMDTVSIIVDLRINRIGAAAAILIALVLIGAIFGGREALRDGTLFVKHTLAGDTVLSSLTPEGLQSFRDNLVSQGHEVICYNESLNTSDRFAILMHWKVSDDEYSVVLGDLSTLTVSARTLIRLQAHMLQNPPK